MPRKKTKLNNARHLPINTTKYIITPGIYHYFSDFLNLYEVAKGEPIMIVGDTGVGKSMFLYIANELYKKDHNSEDKDYPVCWVNCAHFDQNLARSELFGHKKGSFSGAIEHTDGFIFQADNGLLVLEEMGELPFEVQAMLLTFIETGQYKRVGGSKLRHANVRIVGATNREDALREDFRYRFLPFYVPPIHERREDVLYYLCQKFPDLIPTLTLSEVLTIIAYHWPGNIREINRVGFLMQKHKLEAEKTRFDSEHSKVRFDSMRLWQLDKRYTFLDSSLAMQELRNVKAWDGDIKLLESLLNKYNVGMSDENPKLPFEDLDAPAIIKWNAFRFESLGDFENDEEYIEQQFGVMIPPNFTEFDDAFEGYIVFCRLFGQDPFKNKNILSDLENTKEFHFDISSLNLSPSGEKDVKRLVKAIMHSIVGITVEGYKYPDNLFQYWQVLQKQKRNYIQKINKPQNIPDKNLDIFSMKEDELRKTYYEGLLKKSGGNVRLASKYAGVKETTFRGRMDKLEIAYKKYQK